jgi:hypothetical protein
LKEAALPLLTADVDFWIAIDQIAAFEPDGARAMSLRMTNTSMRWSRDL